VLAVLLLLVLAILNTPVVLEELETALLKQAAEEPPVLEETVVMEVQPELQTEEVAAALQMQVQQAVRDKRHKQRRVVKAVTVVGVLVEETAQHLPRHQ
jgi:hypothetical protein